jgi:hypothetical protein
MSHRSWQDWERGEGDAVSNIPKIEKGLGLEPGWFQAQLGVLERLQVYEARLIEMDRKLTSLLEGQRALEQTIRFMLG